MVADVPILEELRELVRADPRKNGDIAKAASIHPTTFSSFVKGHRGLSVDTAERLAVVLGKPLRLGEPVTPIGGRRGSSRIRGNQ